MPHKKPKLGHRPTRRAPSERELEIALLELLRKNHFIGSEQVSVLVLGRKSTPIYIVTLGADVAKVLQDLVDPVLGRRTQPSPTEWVLFRPDADAILEAARQAF